MKRVRVAAAGVLIAAWLGGCASSEPTPIDDEYIAAVAIQEAFDSPGMSTLADLTPFDWETVTIVYSASSEEIWTETAQESYLPDSEWLTSFEMLFCASGELVATVDFDLDGVASVFGITTGGRDVAVGHAGVGHDSIRVPEMIQAECG